MCKITFCPVCNSGCDNIEDAILCCWGYDVIVMRERIKELAAAVHVLTTALDEENIQLEPGDMDIIQKATSEGY